MGKNMFLSSIHGCCITLVWKSRLQGFLMCDQFSVFFGQCKIWGRDFYSLYGFCSHFNRFYPSELQFHMKKHNARETWPKQTDNNRVSVDEWECMGWSNPVTYFIPTYVGLSWAIPISKLITTNLFLCTIVTAQHNSIQLNCSWGYKVNSWTTVTAHTTPPTPPLKLLEADFWYATLFWPN